MQPYLVIRHLVDHIAFPADSSSLQNVDYARALLNAIIVLVNYKEVHSPL